MKNAVGSLLIVLLCGLAARAREQTQPPPPSQSTSSDDQGAGAVLDQMKGLALPDKTKNDIEARYIEDRKTARDGQNDDQARAAALKQIDDNYSHLAKFLSEQPAGSMDQAAQKWLGVDGSQQKKVFDALNSKALDSVKTISFDPEKGDFQFDKTSAGKGTTSAVMAMSQEDAAGKAAAQKPALQKGLKTAEAPTPGAYPAGGDDKGKPFKLSDTQKAGVVSGFWGALLFGLLMGPAGLIIGGGIAAAAGYAMAKQGSDDSGGGDKKKSGGGGGHHEGGEHKESAGSKINRSGMGGVMGGHL